MPEFIIVVSQQSNNESLGCCFTCSTWTKETKNLPFLYIKAHFLYGLLLGFFIGKIQIANLTHSELSLWFNSFFVILNQYPNYLQYL